MKKALIGAGGFAREIMAHMDLKMVCFVDDKYAIDDILPISKFDPDMYEVMVAIGDGKLRRDMVNKLPKNTKYFSFIHPSATIMGRDIKIGEGSIICANSILTTNIEIGDHCHLNLSTTIGHDCVIGDFFTTAPGVNISGNCEIGDFVYLGSNSSIKQKIKICDEAIIGLNCGVVKNIDKKGTYVGTPAKLMKI